MFGAMTANAWFRISLLASLLSVITVGSAHADDGPDPNKAFQAAVDDMLAGRFAAACPALAQVYLQTQGAGALYTQAECEAKWGKVTAARAHYREYLALYEAMSPKKRKGQFDRAEVSTRQIEALGKLLAKVTVSLPANAPEGTVVTRDGEELDAQSLGDALEMDPGGHRFTVVLPSGEKRGQDLVLLEGEERSLRLELPATEATAEEGSDGDAWRTSAYVVGGVGAVGIVVGIVTGAVAISAKGTVSDECVEEICTEDGKAAGNRLKVFGHTSTVAFSIGAAALAVGVVLFLTAPDDAETGRATSRWQIATSAWPEDPQSVLVGLQRAW
jgi:hypothetical protein